MSGRWTGRFGFCCRARISSNLSAASSDRYMRLGSSHDLERAVGLAREAVAGAGARSRREGRAAVATVERAARAVSANGDTRRRRGCDRGRAAGGGGRSGRHVRTIGREPRTGRGGARERGSGGAADIDEAVRAFEEVERCHAIESAGTREALLSLGVALRLRYRLDPTDPADRDRALAVLQGPSAESTGRLAYPGSFAARDREGLVEA